MRGKDVDNVMPTQCISDKDAKRLSDIYKGYGIVVGIFMEEGQLRPCQYLVDIDFVGNTIYVARIVDEVVG